MAGNMNNGGIYKQWITPEGLEVVGNWCRIGYTDIQIAEKMGITERTLYLWKNKFPEFKEAMDAYEAFYDEYCDFMIRYQDNPTDLMLVAQYGQLLIKMAEVNEAFEKWDESELNNEELKYYLEVSSRVMQKLVDVTG